jgi:hypothetical protein
MFLNLLWPATGLLLNYLFVRSALSSGQVALAQSQTRIAVPDAVTISIDPLDPTVS